MCSQLCQVSGEVFSHSDPKKGSSGSAATAPAPASPATQDVAVSSADDDAICCVPPLPRDRPITPLKGGVVISCAWYTSGNPLNCSKSDQAGMVIR